MSEAGFTTTGRPIGGDAEVRPIGVGMLGYQFMGKAHSNAYRTLSYMTWPPPLLPELVTIAGRTEDAVAEAATRFGFAGHVTDWQVGTFAKRTGKHVHGVKIGYEQSRASYARQGYMATRGNTRYHVPPTGSSQGAQLEVYTLHSPLDAIQQH